MNLLKNEQKISDSTVQEKIGMVQGELIGLGLANEAKRAGIELTEEQTKATIANVQQGWKGLSIQDRNAVANMMNSETARRNSDTNLREYLETVRKNDTDMRVKEGALRLEQMIRDVPESTKLTVGTITSIFGSVTGMFKKKG